MWEGLVRHAFTGSKLLAPFIVFLSHYTVSPLLSLSFSFSMQSSGGPGFVYPDNVGMDGQRSLFVPWFSSK